MSHYPANARFGLRLSILPKKIAYTEHHLWWNQSVMANCGLRASGRSTTVQWVVALWSNLLFSTLVHAQIVPDATLGTQVFGACGITNGSTRGSNLFHSFQQFSLPNGDFAAFITNPAIQNVIVRVTGVGQPFISNINGAISTSNPANFFLLNPNGIIFGPGAALDIRGSFLATTADRMQFQDGVEFRTTDPAPLLTINVPIGLGFTGVLKPIHMRSSFLSRTLEMTSEILFW